MPASGSRGEEGSQHDEVGDSKLQHVKKGTDGLLGHGGPERGDRDAGRTRLDARLGAFRVDRRWAGHDIGFVPEGVAGNVLANQVAVELLDGAT